MANTTKVVQIEECEHHIGDDDIDGEQKNNKKSFKPSLNQISIPILFTRFTI